MARRRRASGKGALIQGMSRRLSGALLGDPLFRQSLAAIIRGWAGIYGLYRGTGLYYAGLTNDLLRRVKRHQRDRHAGRWDHFVIFRIRRVRYLKDIETLVLSLAEPPGNLVRGRVPRDADLNRVLQRAVADTKARLRAYEAGLRG